MDSSSLLIGPRSTTFFIFLAMNNTSPALAKPPSILTGRPKDDPGMLLSMSSAVTKKAMIIYITNRITTKSKTHMEFMPEELIL